MKKENLKLIFLLIICLTGSLLIGFNANKLSNAINVVLFVIGVLLLSSSITIVGLIETIFKRKDKNNDNDR